MEDPLNATTVKGKRRSSSGDLVNERVVLTIIGHPNLERIGDRAIIDEGCHLSRISPDFGGRPLTDPHISRQPLVTLATATEHVNVAILRKGEVKLDGRVQEQVRIDNAALRDGITIECRRPCGAVAAQRGRS